MNKDRIRVVIVDDSKDTVENVITMLGLCGHHIEVVGSALGGQDGIRLCQKVKPHIVLMDINMPDMDGLTATKLLSTALPDTGIIIMSVQAENEYLKRAMDAGARDYLIKPFSTDELNSAVIKAYEVQKKKIS